LGEKCCSCDSVVLPAEILEMRKKPNIFTGTAEIEHRRNFESFQAIYFWIFALRY
jgi:hypothetical protein